MYNIVCVFVHVCACVLVRVCFVAGAMAAVVADSSNKHQHEGRSGNRVERCSSSHTSSLAPPLLSSPTHLDAPVLRGWVQRAACVREDAAWAPLAAVPPERVEWLVCA